MFWKFSGVKNRSLLRGPRSDIMVLGSLSLAHSNFIFFVENIWFRDFVPLGLRNDLECVSLALFRADPGDTLHVCEIQKRLKFPPPADVSGSNQFSCGLCRSPSAFSIVCNKSICFLCVLFLVVGIATDVSIVQLLCELGRCMACGLDPATRHKCPAGFSCALGGKAMHTTSLGNCNLTAGFKACDVLRFPSIE